MGNGPAAGADAFEAWERLSELPRPTSKPIEVRARGEVIGRAKFWVLTAAELSQVPVDAEKAAKAALGDDAKVGSLAYEEEYQQHKAYGVVNLALRQDEDVKFPFIPRLREVREKLTDDEIAVLLEQYGQFRRQSGPILHELTDEEMEAWVRLLQEGAGRVPLARCSGEALIDLIMFLVSKLPRAEGSATPTSSAGSPPGESSTRSSSGGSGDGVAGD